MTKDDNTQGVPVTVWSINAMECFPHFCCNCPDGRCQKGHYTRYDGPGAALFRWVFWTRSGVWCHVLVAVAWQVDISKDACIDAGISEIADISVFLKPQSPPYSAKEETLENLKEIRKQTLAPAR